ncbi:hypothetical protein HMN09_01299900 [Mycena chlorophos]|uniref:DUF6534 domain-containing protein n=1 Tax=Mycena chlorophos TaxID=658473 RepID=A0A8H6VUD6_MYCCL|nr:hypothetical protein HMN09_01299900 [Mycena chlorophos]
MSAALEAFNPNPTLGALLIGVLGGCVLYGVSTMQVYMYYQRFPDDHRIMKFFVMFIWIAEGTHVGAIANTLYTLCIIDYGHPERLLERPPREEPLVAPTQVRAAHLPAVQLFFSYRILILSRSRIIPYLMTVISLIRFALGTSLFAVGLNVTSVTEFGTKWQWLGIAMWGLSAVEDMTITSTLVYLLMIQRKNVHRSTTAFLDKIIMWSIETGLLTSSFSLTTVILYHTMPNNYIWVAFSTLEARMFANSLYASLNSRATLRDMQGTSRNLNFSASGLNTTRSISFFKPFSAASKARKVANPEDTITVDVQVTSDRDSLQNLNSQKVPGIEMDAT